MQHQEGVGEPRLSITPKVLMHAGQCVLVRESILEQNGQGSLALLSHWLLLKVLVVKFLKVPKVIGA
jgi:hypothetical protein